MHFAVVNVPFVEERRFLSFTQIYLAQEERLHETRSEMGENKMRNYAELKKEISPLVMEMKNGNMNVFDEVYAMTYGMFEEYGRNNLTDDAYLVQDAMQETYVTIMNKIDSLKDPASFIPWSITIFRNAVNMEFRKRKRLTLVDDRYTDEDHMALLEKMISKKDDQTTEDTITNNELLEEVFDAILNLSAAQKFALVAHVIDGMSIKDIAYMMDCPEGTVKSRINSARAKIKETVNYDA